MTLVEAQYRFTAPFQDEFTAAIQNAHSHYGLRAVKLHPKLDGVTVLYDASRLTLDEVDRTLRGLGLPLTRAAEEA
jgi:hypothetical protein